MLPHCQAFLRELNPETMEENVAQTPNAKDPLEDCLQVVLTFYGAHPDLKGLISETAKEPGPLKPPDIVKMAGKLDYIAEITNFTVGRLKKTQVPLIAILKDGSACVCLPQKTHQGKIYKPGEGIVETTVDSIAGQLTGETVVLYPRAAEGGISTEHMRKGHVTDWFWRPIAQYWPSYAEVLIASLFINLLALALPLYTLNVYDRVVVNFAEATLQVLFAGICIAFLFDFLFKLVRSYVLERVAADIGTKYDFDLMERLLLLNVPNMNLSVGERANLFREMQGIRDFYAQRLIPTIVDLPFVILFLLVIYMLAPPVVIVPIVGAVLVLAVNLLGQIPVNRATEKYFTAIQGKSTVMIETLAGMRAVKMFNAIGARLFDWQVASAASAQASRKNNFIMAIISNISLLMTNLVQATVVFYGVYEIHVGELSVGGLIACTILSARCMAPVMSLSGVIAQLQQTADVLESIDRIFRLPYEGQHATRKSPKGPFKGQIELQNVSYQYEGQVRPALYQVTMGIKPGDRVGLIGRSGAGKTTLARLVNGFLTAQEGSVMIDGFSIDAISPAELRRSIGFVPQDPFLFSGSIRHNILMGAGEVSDEMFERALKISGLDIVMQQTGQGLDTEVGETGDRLSGGQKQAISLARAVIRNPSVVIFDEPTTGMDSALEARVKETLTSFLKGRTFIMVTHRTSLLTLVNRLVLLDKGRVVADGPRDEILQKLGG